MNSRRLWWLALLALPGTGGFAQTQPTEPGLVVGFEERVRNENWNNILDFRSTADDEREQIRHRTRFWVSAPLGKGISFYVGLDQETNQNLSKDPCFDEIFFENAYLNFDRVFVKGLSLRVGRQNMIHGEGFVLMDGTSGDGSRSLYFNGIDLSYKFKQSNLEWIGISDPAQDRYLPSIHDQHKMLQNWDERALGVYYTDRNIRRVTLESYWFYKQEVNDRTPLTSAQHQADRFLNTGGGRASVRLTADWLAVGEFAVQYGHQVGGKQIRGKGGYGYIKRTFDRRWSPYLQAGYIGLSGSDPSKPNVIGDWDPLFSRWPKWSELYIYSQVPEHGVAYWTNTNIYQAEGGFAPSKRIKARITYNRFGAYHPFAGSPVLFSNGLFRGNNYQGRVDFALNRYMAAHVLYEYMSPGAFHTGKDPGYFLRFETSFLVKNLIPAHGTQP